MEVTHIEENLDVGLGLHGAAHDTIAGQQIPWIDTEILDSALLTGMLTHTDTGLSFTYRNADTHRYWTQLTGMLTHTDTGLSVTYRNAYRAHGCGTLAI